NTVFITTRHNMHAGLICEALEAGKHVFVEKPLSINHDELENVRGFRIGDRVACGGAGYANHAEYNYIPKNLVVKIPENVSFEDASCTTVGSIAMQGVRQCNVRLGEIVCVMGLGLLGILAVQMLKSSGVKVIGFDPNPERCKLAEEMGADFTADKDLESVCTDFSDGYGVDAVLITAATKSNEPVACAGEICRMKGIVVVTGMVGMDIPREMYYKKEIDFKLSLSYGPGRYDPSYEESGNDYPYGYVRWTEQRNMKAFLDLVSEGKLTPSKLITHHFDIENALDAYGLMLGKIDEPYLGIVLNYGVKDPGIKSTMKKTVIKRNGKTSSSISLGFIGAGNFSKAVLLPELKKKQDIRLKGICSATGMNALETGKKEAFEYATTDYRQILEDTDINTVFITTRHNMHAGLICEALEAGKHVFVEKPLSINHDELENVKISLEKNPGILTVGFNRRFSPHARLINDYYKNRTTPVLLSYRVNAGLIPPDSWIQDMNVGGGRIIGEVCHFIDFASYIIGHDPKEVQAICVNTNNSSLIAEDNASLCIKYEDGSVANILYAALGSAELSKERCEIFADESVSIMDDFCSTTCFGKRGSKKLKGKQAKGFSEEISTFFNSIKENSHPIPIRSLFN
ncbi:Gfo/Idh/MocA family oxidoreductase, partial [Desulfobacterales bacterium HSG17]|nr:Gfo/Idh/MocA family oxidoreductase [Desulfobacterales bacterium HSG17]